MITGTFMEKIAFGPEIYYESWCTTATVILRNDEVAMFINKNIIRSRDISEDSRSSLRAAPIA